MSGMVENCPKISQLFFENLSDNHFLKAPITINISLNAVLALTATLGNGMIIVAILRSQNLQTPSYLLITSLAFTDLLIGLVFHPLLSILNSYYLQGKVHEVCRMTKPVIFFGVLVGYGSMLMVTCISIDRYLALTLRHRYNVIVTKKRVCLSIVFAWSSVFLLAILNMPEELFDIVFVAESFILLVLFSITCVFYIKSFRALHLYTVQVQAQQPNPLAGNFDIVKYKKTLKTMLVVLVQRYSKYLCTNVEKSPSSITSPS
ncbi:histamine H2 receptor-like [Actinia tenebrosa]|uniref:Histamine H2 receptor-like n=1 Tax=Actinia tenebrosa TaxID=6105 RepID=A0A6P8JCJ2_ACTTE|nr:histamine H2 receptor-like [Actinia tenebrosa]